MKITSFAAREVLDSRGNPTAEVEINGQRAIVPSGASTGAHEALELRDGGARYHGKGVAKAVSHAFTLLRKASKIAFESQSSFDAFLLKQDTTKNKHRLGANAINACSIAFFKALAASRHTPVWSFFKKPREIPIPLCNVINGGAHASSGLSIQEFMIIPDGLKSTPDALEFMSKAIRECGYEKQISIGVDCAATQYYKDNHYYLDGTKHHAEALGAPKHRRQKEFPMTSFEDRFYEET